MKTWYALGGAPMVLTAILTAASLPAKAESIKVGGILLDLKAGVSQTYDDNIYSRDDNPIDDSITTLEVGADATWRGSDTYVAASLTGVADFYADNSKENREQYRLRGDWIHDVHESLRVRASLDHRRRVSLRGNSFDDPGRIATEGTVAYSTAPSVLVEYAQGRFVAEAGVDAYHIAYENNHRGNGSLIEQDRRDRLDIGGYVEPGVVIMPNTVAYLRGEYEQSRYSKDSVGNQRDNDSVLAALGIKYELPGRLLMEAWAGPLHVDFEGATLDDQTLALYGAEARWTMTDQVETRLTIERYLSPTISTPTTLIVTDRVRLSGSYSPLERLTLEADASYNWRDFRDSASASDGSDRSDDYITGSVSGLYAITDVVDVGLAYEHRHRTSNVDNQDFSRNIVSLFVQASF
jgi:hypothetical protein